MSEHTIAAYWPTIAAVLLLLLPALITGLSRYPRASGFVTGLRVVFDVLSVVTHADSPGSFKLPILQRSQPPGSVVQPLSLPPAALIPLAFLLAASPARAQVAPQIPIAVPTMAIPASVSNVPIPAPAPVAAASVSNPVPPAAVNPALPIAGKDEAAAAGAACLQCVTSIAAWWQSVKGKATTGAIIGGAIVGVGQSVLIPIGSKEGWW